jgi:hypothetical protein
VIKKHAATQGTLAIGVTGHRFLAEMDRVAAGVAEALDRIRDVFPAQRWTIVSPLAEGADRLVVHQALARAEVRLVVPLPLPQPDYMADFQSAASQEEFQCLLALADEVITLPLAPTRDQAYAAVGRYVLDHCDLLVAIWDGKGAQGQGGAGEIVAQARQRGLPMAWVHAGNRKPGTQEPTTLGEEQGVLTFERFPGRGST